MASIEEMELQLHGTGLADGEITFSALSQLTEAFQQLTMRIGRHLTGQHGTGRSTAVVERATELRLRGTTAGSTVLQVAVGEQNVLDAGLEHRTVDALFEIFRGIAADEAPPWVTALVGEATVAVIEALDSASTGCELSSRSERIAPVRFSARTASRVVWTIADSPRERRSGVSVSGRLDLVDLRRPRFRIRDFVGNDVHLDQVSDADTVARRVGTLVTATGEAILGSRGQVTTLVGAVIEPTQSPGWTTPSLEDAFHGAEAPADGGIDGVDADEVTTFLALIRG